MKFHKSSRKKHEGARSEMEREPLNEGPEPTEEKTGEAGIEAPAEPSGAAPEEAEKPEDLAGKVAGLEDQLLRLRAEYANFKRRTDKEKSQISLFVKASVFKEIIPTLDDFERFFNHVEQKRESLDQDFVQGIEMIHKSLVSALRKQGIEEIGDSFVPFDPNLHEAMLTGPVEEEKDDHTVLQVLESGYRIGEMVIRPAKVKVGLYNQ
jgi:molecular chaperone GrpE